MILRLYGQANTIHAADEGFDKLASLFPPFSGARQIFDMTIESVQTSCGYAVPFFQFEGQRNKLSEWAQDKGKEGIQQYWQERNKVSIDGFETGMK